MGCCELRGNQTKTLQKLSDQKFNPNSSASTNSRFSDLAQHWDHPFLEEEEADLRVRTIEGYLSAASKDTEWISHIGKSDFLVRMKPGGAFNPDIPMTLSFIDLNVKVCASKIVNSLLVPEFRLAWDTTLVRMDIIRTVSENSHIIRYIKKYPFVHREFTVKSTLFNDDKTTNIVIYSTSNPEPSIDHSLVRGEIIFCVYKVIETSSSTVIMCMQQIDNKGITGRLYTSLVASEHTQWLASLKKALGSSSFIHSLTNQQLN